MDEPILTFSPESSKPQVLRVSQTGDAVSWVAQHREMLRSVTSKHGSLIVRGLPLRSASEVSAAFRHLGCLMPERERFAPRERYSDCVYSTSRWPANQRMCLHNELSYAQQPPTMVLFACLVAPSARGETIVAGSHEVLNALPDALVDKFERLGWLLIRNYSPELGESIADAFGLDDRGAVERYCRANAIDFEWKANGLRTWQRRNAIVTHAVTGKRCWFNQIAFLNEWTMDSDVHEYLLDLYGEEGLSFNTYFGNGERIDREIIELINEVYTRHTSVQRWQAGDLMLIDNILTAHGRECFEGQREVLAAIADPLSLSPLLAPGKKRVTTNQIGRAHV